MRTARTRIEGQSEARAPVRAEPSLARLRSPPTTWDGATVPAGKAGTLIARPASLFGAHRNVEGALPSPDGRSPIVTTAWTRRAGEQVWRFATRLPR